MTKTQFPIYVRDKDYDKTGWKNTSEAILWDPWTDQANWDPNDKNWRKFHSSKIPEYIYKMLEEKVISRYGTIITDVKVYAEINEACRALYVTVS
ncbi:MAG: hypothetical protein IJJ57_06755 [Ruminococcus sp.]|nr:hypothetical protein [Ruminococcus sp.]